jgi:general stress protein 26
MAVQEVDEQGNIWFLISGDSETNQQITADADVQLLFQGSHHSDFLSITGSASTSRDKEKIKKFWNPIFKTWFTEGEMTRV